MNTILVPLDGSDFSAQVLPALKKFFAPQTTSLVFFTVGSRGEGYVGLPSRPASTEIPVPMYESQQDIEMARHPIYASQELDSRTSALTDQFETQAQALRSEGYTVTVEADYGNPAEAIIERSRSGEIDLIAMTTHGRSGISRLIFGSVAEQVLRHVQVPVFLVRPVAEQGDDAAAK